MWCGIMNKEIREELLREELLETEKYLEREKRDINNAIDYLRLKAQDPYNDLALRDAYDQTKIIKRKLDIISRTVGRIQNLKYRLEKL